MRHHAITLTFDSGDRRPDCPALIVETSQCGNFRLWLSAEVPRGEPALPLCPQEQTSKTECPFPARLRLLNPQRWIFRVRVASRAGFEFATFRLWAAKPKRLFCSFHSIGKGFIRSDSCSDLACLPLRIASIISGARSESRRIRLTYDGLIFSASASSASDVYTPSSSRRFQRWARMFNKLNSFL